MKAGLHCPHPTEAGDGAPTAALARAEAAARRRRGLRRRTVLGWGGALLVASGAAQAGMPADYAPIVVQPTPADAGRVEFDLRPALAQARKAGKRLYVYMGASDCKYCRRYEAFLASNAGELKAHFAKDWLVADLRSQLGNSAEKLLLRTGDRALPYADFQRSIGDERARLLVYPTVWVLDNQGKPLMQMPAGAGTFETVPEQLEILRLEQ